MSATPPQARSSEYHTVPPAGQQLHVTYNLAVGDTTVTERETEALSPTAEVKHFGNKGVLMHLWAGKSAYEPSRKREE